MTTYPCIPPEKRARRVVLSGVLAFALCFGAVFPASAGADPLPEEKAAAVLDRLRDGAGSITSLHADFIQEKHIPELEATLFGHGRVSLRAPNSLRWEMLFPVKAWYVLNGNTSASWTGAAGQAVKTPLRETPRANEIARFVVSCLAFNEQDLRRRCVLDVTSENPPTVRLVLKNDMLRVHLSELVLTFTPDGTLPQSIRVMTAKGGNSLITLHGAVRDDALLRSHDRLEQVLADRPVFRGKEYQGAGRFFSAMLTEDKRRLPLLLYVWRDAPPGGGDGKEALHCVAFTEILLRIGGVTVTPGNVAAVPAVPDNQMGRVLERIGTALRHAGSGTGEIRWKGEGWALDAVWVDDVGAGAEK